MRKPIWILATIFAATPLFAQDDAPATPFGGGGGAQVFTRVDAVNPMEQVKAFLAKANVTLSPDQEKTLRPAVEAAIKQLQDISDRSAAERGGRGAGRGQGGQNGQDGQDGERRGGGRRGRGEGRGGGIAFLANGPAAQELRKMNDDLMAKITAVLKPDQQAAFKKFQNDEIKKAGGFAALKVVMEEAGAPLTAEQEPQIQTVYTEDAQQRVQVFREAQGRPDPAKLADLEKTTMGKVARLLTPAQRKALLDSRTKQQ
jgi:hypothetical protein